jgi:RNA polymerase sigma factor (sigma-70 family)
MAGVAAQLPQARVPATALKVLGDDRLARLVSRGDSRAFEVIYERHHQALYRYCRSIVGNAEDAADALQSTMASALRALSGEQREIDLRPWLFRIAHNESVSLLRKRRPHASIDDAIEMEAPAHDPAVAQRLKELVSDLRELPDTQRGALVMHELNGLRYREIAAALGTTEPHARQLVYEARRALYDLAEGRDMECESVRRTISDGDRRMLRGRRIRSHLRTCEGCAGFEQLIRTRKSHLAAIAPPLPAALAAGLLHKILGGGGGSAGTGAGLAAGSSGGAGLGAAAAGKGLAIPALSKLLAGVALTAAVGTGAVEVATTHHSSDKGPSAAATAATAKAGQRSAREHSTSISAPAGGRVTTQNLVSPHAKNNGNNGLGLGRTKTGHPAHPAHPVHPTHPTHPVKKTHPVHPSRPAQPAKPTHPSHPDHPLKPAKPTHPVTPAPTTKAPASTSPAPTAKTPVVPPGQQNESSAVAGGNGRDKVTGLINELAP